MNIYNGLKRFGKGLEHFSGIFRLFVEKISHFLNISSVLLNEVRDLCFEKYEVEMIFEQDRDAIISRLQYIQNHEGRIREGWS